MAKYSVYKWALGLNILSLDGVLSAFLWTIYSTARGLSSSSFQKAECVVEFIIYQSN